ncbi:MAG: zinc ribbon domain-containing protein [Eggerthellaceae bacterium]|nr:zinc ribbon domain-containing protein [Eggerthellaceae bacterium]
MTIENAPLDESQAQDACPSCGAPLPEGAKFCLECGTKVDSSKITCPACGRMVTKGKFCPECGHRQLPGFGSIKRGDEFKIGNYHGPIAWKVLKKEDGKVLLISEKCLDSKPYNEKWTSVTWETCSIRAWLNSEFFFEAFSETERASIVATKVKPANNADYKISGGNETTDKIFLLSITEAEELLDKESGPCPSAAQATDYAKEQGVYVAPNGNAWWRLRSPGIDQRGAAYVGPGGLVVPSGMDVDYGAHGIRPAMWIALEA